MMRPRLFLALAMLTTPACFHTTVSTGLAPMPGETRKNWADGWLWGLIGPSTVWTSAICPHGLAVVETERSFGNLFVSAVSLGLYTPMSIRFRCAAARPVTP